MPTLQGLFDLPAATYDLTEDDIIEVVAANLASPLKAMAVPMSSYSGPLPAFYYMLFFSLSYCS